MIKASNLKTGYSTSVIKNLSFELADGLTHGLIGANGVGKTTLLRALAGQLPAEGITVDGHEPFDNPAVLDKTVLMGICLVNRKNWMAMLFATTVPIAATIWLTVAQAADSLSYSAWTVLLAAAGLFALYYCALPAIARSANPWSKGLKGWFGL